MITVFHQRRETQWKSKGEKRKKKSRQAFVTMVNFVPFCSALSLSDQLNLIHKLQVFTIHGRDKFSRKILRIVGKFVPEQFVSREALKKYFDDVVLPRLGEKPFSVVYFDTDVESLSVFRSICDLIPSEIRDHDLHAIYFVHSGLKTRLVLSAFGCFFFTGGLQKKIKYVNRVDFLWDHMKRTEIEIPEFAKEHDEALDFRPVMDYGLVGDHRAVADSSLNLYSLRCTA